MLTKVNKKVNKRIAFVACASSVAALPLLEGCASSGLYYMSDEWCGRHLDASPAHCPVNQSARNDSNDVQQLDPQRSGLASR